MPVYLDHNATTPVDARVVEAMLPWLQTHFGNPSSVHSFGRACRQAIDEARVQVAHLVGVQPTQVIFTSGGTEANNLALKGIAANLAIGRIAVSAIEHSSVSDCVGALAANGWQIDRIGVDAEGRIDADALEQAIGPDTGIVSVMRANNVTGVLLDTDQAAEAAQRRGAFLHIDAIQAAGKVPLDFPSSGAHAMSLSAHKLYGPKGIGALIVDKALDLSPQIHGGGHEKGLRSGTENVAGIVGFGLAAELAHAELGSRRTHLGALSQQLETALKTLGGITIAAANAPRVPNTTLFSVPGIDGETLLLQLDQAGFAVSSGSACSSASPGPNPVLLAMGYATELARNTIRVSLGKDNTAADVDAFIAALKDVMALMATLSGTQR